MTAPPPLTRPARPTGITLLGCFFVFGTLASGLSTLSLLTPGGILEPIWRLNPRGHEGLASLGSWAAVLLGIVCLACAASAIGFFRGRPWGYRLGLALLLVNGLGDVVNTVSGIEPRAAIGVPIVALLLWYLTTAKVRGWFFGSIAGAYASAARPPS